MHCNVGGGYLDSELSDIAFLWMQEKAKACGLEFDQAYIDAKIKPHSAGALRDSKTGLFHLRRDFIRPIGQGRNTREFVHGSALARMEDANVRPVYQPDNLRDYLAANGRNGVIA